MKQTVSAKTGAGAVFLGTLALGFGFVSPAGATTYTYDALGRVVTVTNTNGVITSYSYDSAGNRTGQTVNMTLPIARPTIGPIPVPENSINFIVTPTLLGPPAASVANTTNPSHGALTINGLTFKYTPTQCYVGADGFQYTASNGSQSSQPALISLDVTLVAPTVSAISQVIATNSTDNWINVINGDLSSHILCPQVTGLAITTPPNNGGTATAQMTATGPQIKYTPATGFSGTETFQYAASNTAGASIPASVNVTVNSSRSIWNQFQWNAGTW